MTIKAIGDEELLDYVIEKDFEDTTSRIILSAISAFEEGAGKGKIEKLLRGKGPGMVLSGNYELLDHYGRLSLLNRDQILDFIESLIRIGLLEVSGPDFPRLILTRKGDRALKKDKSIPAMIPWPLPSKEIPLPMDGELFQDLKNERNSIAREEGIPPYCIASNISLVEIVNRGIVDPSELMDVPGFGETRTEKYGKRLLSIVQPMG